MIKSYNAQKGFGFIDCPEARAQFGRDVFIHKAEVGSLEVGTEVIFVLETNRDGFPQARETSRFGERYGNAIMDEGRQGGKGKKRREGKPKKKAKAKASPPNAPSTKADASGSVEVPAAAPAATDESAEGKEAPVADDADGEGDFNCDADSDVGGAEANEVGTAEKTRDDADSATGDKAAEEDQAAAKAS